MTVSTTASTGTFQGNGATTAFSFSYIGVTASDIQVLYTNSSGTTSVLSPSVYTLSLNAPATGQLWGIGGTVTYPLMGSPIAAGTSITIQRIVPLTQTTSISNQGDFAPTVIESALDTLCFEIQQVSARTGQMRGTWATGILYNFGDVVQDGANGAGTGNYYMCAIANTSGVWATDLANGYWSLVINTQSFTTVAGGTNGQIQYNNAGALGGLDSTGTGNVARATSPSFTTPTLGVATATSVNKVVITAPASAATLTIANNKTLTVSNTLTLAGTDSTTMTFPSSSTTIPGLTVANNIFTIASADNTLTIQSTTSGNAYFVSDSVSGYTGIQGSASATAKWWIGTRGTNTGGMGIWTTNSSSFDVNALAITGPGVATFVDSVSAKSFIPTASTVPANGMYLPAANVVGIACNTLNVARFEAAASNVNYIRFLGSATGIQQAIIADGSDTNSGFDLFSKGTGLFRFFTAGTPITSAIQAFAINSSQHVYVGTAALATNATTGFFWIPSCAGTPTGSPTAPYANAAAMVADTSANKLWVRIGTTWKFVTLS